MPRPERQLSETEYAAVRARLGADDVQLPTSSTPLISSSDAGACETSTITPGSSI